MPEIWFWHLIISPHMSALAVALARQGRRVIYVAQHEVSEDRVRLGWTAPELPGVVVRWAESDNAVLRLVQDAPADAIHVCGGLRSNGRVRIAQRALARRQRQQWVVMETVDDAGVIGFVKRLVYASLFSARCSTLRGVLATGHRTAAWVAARGMPAARVFPFAYFLPQPEWQPEGASRQPRPFRFIYVGQMVPRKRVDWILRAFTKLTRQPSELWLVGGGSQEESLRAMASRLSGTRVRWFGRVPISDVPALMAQADCLLLPSRHDGWGAVASEALMTGLPVVCSDACGVAEVVRASGAGGVFPVGDPRAFAEALERQISRGQMEDGKRRQLSIWATCLGAEAGAGYLQEILNFVGSDDGVRPVAPWLRSGRPCAD